VQQVLGHLGRVHVRVVEAGHDHALQVDLLGVREAAPQVIGCAGRDDVLADHRQGFGRSARQGVDPGGAEDRGQRRILLWPPGSVA
jgi:hypothetical protein